MTSSPARAPRSSSWIRALPNGRHIVVESFVVVLLMLATVWLHLAIPGFVPSGPDGGNWLAMAQDRFMGRDVMSAAVTYPPLLPFSLAAFLLVMDPLGAVVTMALLAKSLVVVATYVCARPIGRLHAVVAAVLVGVAGTQLEAYSWGAYPQLLGTAFGTTSVFYAVRFVGSRRRLHLWAAAVLAVATYATHTLVGGLLVFAMPFAIAHSLWLKRSHREDWIRGLWTALGLSTPGALLAAYNLVLNPQPGVRPVLNPLSLGWTDSLAQTISEAPIPWLVIAVFGVAAILIRRWENEKPATLATAAAWVVVGLLFFIVIGEPRALLLTQLGLVLLAVLFFQRLIDFARSARRSRRGLIPAAALRVLVVLGVATVSAIVVGGVDSYATATSWYRVVDHSEIRALDALKAAADPGDLVVASQGHHGNQIGWWVQGYAGIPTYTGVDLRVLTFPEEREQAQIANGFFEQKAGDAESLEALKTIGADFLMVDRRGPHAVWLESGIVDEFELIYDSSTVVVLQVPDDLSQNESGSNRGRGLAS